MLPSLLIQLFGGGGLVTELCMTLCDPMDGRPAPPALPDASVHGIPQAKMMERVAISISRGSLQPRDGNSVSNRKKRRKNSPIELFAAAAAKSLQSCPTLRSHRRQPTRLSRPWDSPGKNTGVGCHFLLQCMKVKSESEVSQSCPTLRDPMDCSLPGSSAHGIFQARVIEWGAIAFSKYNCLEFLKNSFLDAIDHVCLSFLTIFDLFFFFLMAPGFLFSLEPMRDPSGFREAGTVPRAHLSGSGRSPRCLGQADLPDVWGR